jgi:hypothetical protein
MVTFLELTALCGNYVNFGVFELYGDRALADALDVSLKITLSIPLSDILAFRKVLISTLVCYSCLEPLLLFIHLLAVSVQFDSAKISVFSSFFSQTNSLMNMDMTNGCMSM